MTRPAPLHDQDVLTALRAGFDGATAPDPAMLRRCWRIGRWLRSRGSSRPRSVHVVREGVLIVDGQILSMDGFGAIQNLSASRRPYDGRLHEGRVS